MHGNQINSTAGLARGDMRADTPTGAYSDSAAAEARQCRGLKFGQAIEAVKDGQRAARAGWNGKGMFIFMNEGSSDFKESEPIPVLIDGIPRRLFRNGHQGTTTRLPNINMRAASGATVTGWLASQADMLAEDWELV